MWTGVSHSQMGSPKAVQINGVPKTESRGRHSVYPPTQVRPFYEAPCVAHTVLIPNAA